MLDREEGGFGRVLFRTNTPLYRDLKGQAKAYFDRAGLPPVASYAMYAKAAALALSLIAIYTTYLWSRPSPHAVVALAIGCGLAMSGIIFNVHHDAGHGAWSDRRSVNRILAASFDLVGMSSFLWRWKHNRLHHAYPNVEGLDDDIDVAPFARLAPSQPWRPHHRYQHVYLWLLYPFVTIKWALLDDFRELLRGRVGAHPIRRPDPSELALFVGGKLFFLAWMLALPSAIHGFGVALGFYLVSQLTVGVCTALVFQLAHVVEETTRVSSRAPEDAERMDWAAHQIASTSDFSRDSRVARLLLGGLNQQVVHHLFPGVSHAHYPALSRVVEGVCRKHGIAYQPDRRARDLLASHYRWLRQMGRRPAS